jgi:uncharacterized protein
MTFTIRRRAKISFVLVFLSTFSHSVVSQTISVENSLLWEVTGKGLKEPSYLFGTFHLLGSEFIDSLSHVKARFNESKTLAGEMVFDNSMTEKMMKAAVMQDTTLQNLLSEEEYAKTSAWLKELTGMDLRIFDTYNPAMIQLMMVALLQQKLNKKAIVPMDLYFQNLGKDNKKIVGLESFEDQVEVLFSKTSYHQQARHLVEFVNEKESSIEMLVNMNRLYRQEDLAALMKMFFTTSYSSAEQNALLDDRNQKWMTILPGLFQEQRTFVAIGALHLPGENGLVHLLRKAGYTVRPVKSK